MPWWSWLIFAFSVPAVLVLVAARAVAANRETLRALLNLVPDCLALLRDLMRDPQVPVRAKFLAGATVAYLVLPIDLVPDFIPVIGYLDDVLIVAWAIRHITAIAGRERVSAHWRGDRETLERIFKLTLVK